METSLAENFEKENDWERALAEYRKLIVIKPENILFAEKVGWCLSRLQRFDDAVEIYQELSLKEPKKAKWDYMIGYQYYSKKEWKIAAEWFKKALQKFPKYFIVKYRLGYALTQCSGTLLKLKSPEYLEAYKQFDECESLWNSMSEDDKMREKAHFADVCFQKGKILIERKNWELAVNCLQKAVDMYTDNLDYNYCYAKALSGKGESKKALEIISKVKGKYYADELKGEILCKQGDFDQALAVYTKVLEKRTKDYLFRHIANIYLIKNDLRNAYKYAQKAISLGPKNHVNYLLFGKVCYSAGLYITSRDILEKAILLKQEKYDSDFLEASNMLSQVTDEINRLNILEENKEILADLLNNDTDKKRGIIIKYNKDKGFGFINSDKESYFFHISQVPISEQSMVCENMSVLFYSVTTEKGIAAKEINVFR